MATYKDWLAANPYPSIQDLIDQYGSYAAIPDPAWRDHQRAVMDWQAARAARTWHDQMDLIGRKIGKKF